MFIRVRARWIIDLGVEDPDEASWWQGVLPEAVAELGREFGEEVECFELG